jgi:hypothetical protein
VLPGLEKLAQEPLMPNLAISLHATTTEQRDRLVPVNRKYTLEELIDACKRFPVAKRRRITFEYVLLDSRQRHAGGRAASGAAAERDQGESESAALERSAGHRVHAPVGRARQRVRKDPGRSWPGRVCQDAAAGGTSALHAGN